MCITDNSIGLDNKIKAVELDKELYLESYWWKFCIFNPELYESNVPTLYLDLDVIIQKDITYFFDLIQKDKLLTCESCYEENHQDEYKKHPAIINSSIMLFNSKEMKDIYLKFMDNADFNMLEYQGVCRFLYALFRDRLIYLKQFKDFYHFIQRPAGVKRETLKPFIRNLKVKNGKFQCYYISDASIAVLNRTSDLQIFSEAYLFFSQYYENL